MPGLPWLIVANGDARGRTHFVEVIFVEETEGHRIGVALQVASYPIVVIAEAVGEELALGIEQQSRGFGRGTGDDYQLARLLDLLLSLKIRDGACAAVVVSKNLSGDAFGAQVAIAGGDGLGDDGIGGRTFGFDLAGKSHAMRTHDAGGASVVRDGIDGHGDGEGMPSQLSRCGSEKVRLLIEGQRRHRIALRSRGFEGISTGLTGDADFPFGPLVIRFQVLVGDGPVFERAVFRRAIGGTHAEILLHETPGHGAEALGASADAGRHVTVAAFAGRCGTELGIVAEFDEAQVMLVIGTEGVAEYCGALRSQLVVTGFVKLLIAALFQQRHTQAGAREFVRRDSTSCASADDDGVHRGELHP